MMETFLHAVSSVCVILLLTAVGYYCSARGWISPDAKSFLSKFVLRMAMPIMCAYDLRAHLTRDLIAASLPILVLTFFAEVLLFLLSFLAAKLLRLPRRSIGVFMMMSSLSNSIFIGYTMCLELFGEACTPYVMLFYLVNTTFVQMVGLTLIRWSGEHERHSLAQSLLGFIKTPSVLGVLAGFLLVLLDIHLPQTISSTARYISNTVSPIALILAGHIIHEIGLRNIRFDRVIASAMGFRFLLSPALSVFFCALFGVTGLGRDVLAVEMAMPVVTITVVGAAEYGADEALAAQGVALSTLACFVVTPILMVLLG